MLVNVMLRCLDVSIIQKMKDTSKQMSEQGKQEQGNIDQHVLICCELQVKQMSQHSTVHMSW